MKRDIYIISVPRVPYVTRARMAAFIKEAVSVWGGQLAPSGDEFGFDPERHDPLGPPAVLMNRGAVRVVAEARPESLHFHPCYWNDPVQAKALGLVRWPGYPSR